MQEDESVILIYFLLILNKEILVISALVETDKSMTFPFFVLEKYSIDRWSEIL
jgi:hypothetical protein